MPLTAEVQWTEGQFEYEEGTVSIKKFMKFHMDAQVLIFPEVKDGF
jgi:hypothetical protein